MEVDYAWWSSILFIAGGILYTIGSICSYLSLPSRIPN